MHVKIFLVGSGMNDRGGAFEPGLDDTELLTAVLGHYRQALASTATVTGWLTERAITHGEVVAAFGLGWSDRTLGLSLPIGARVAGRELRTRLQRLGVLRDTGHEQFRGCLVVPVTDEQGRAVQLYGHRVQRPQRRAGLEPAEVLWLDTDAAPRTGIWHRQALSSAEVILAGSILDGLVWWSAGYRHVIAPGGPDGLPTDLGDQLITAGVTRVLLASSRTTAGDANAAALTASLAAVGMECFRVVFPHGCDASTVAVEAAADSTDPAAATTALGERLRAAQWLGDGPAPSRQREAIGDGPTPPAPSSRPGRGPRPLPAASGPRPDPPTAQEPAAPSEQTVAPSASPIPTLPPAPPGRDVEVDGGELRVVIGGLAWRVRGLDAVTGPGSLRVNVCVRDSADPGRFHLDVLDLFSARARQSFLATAATELGVRDPERLRRDLGRVLLACEDRVLELQHQAQQPEVLGPTMTAAEEQAAMDLLRDPALLDRITADIAALGVVGETDNALVAYLAATSRLLDTPLAVVVQSGSAAGKSTLTDAVLSLMPTEQRLSVSAMTGQSLYYVGETALAHKILAVAEVEGAERASYALKLLQSDGELSIASTGKDPVSGALVTTTYRVQGPVALFLTTTAPALDDELANRCLVLGVQEDQAQTRAILAAQRHAQTVTGLLAKTEREQVRELHANAQRLLEPLPVVNPHAPALSFSDGRTRARRDQAKLLTLIRAVTLLHQHQRPRKRLVRNGVEVVYLEAIEADVMLAQRLAPLVIAGPDLADLAPQTQRLLMLLDALVTGEAKTSRCRREDVRFTRRHAREHTGWSDFALRRHLARLVDLEFACAHRSFAGTYTYELLWHVEAVNAGNDSAADADAEARIGEYDSPGDAPSMGLRSGFDRGLSLVRTDS